MNRAELPNPNRLKAGSQLKYLPLSAYSSTQISDAKKRSPTWRNYPL